MKLVHGLLIFFILISSRVYADLPEAEAEEVARSFQSKIMQALNLNNATEIASYFSENAILILGNSQIIRTRASIEAFLERPYLEDDIKISNFSINALDIEPGIVIIDSDTFMVTGLTSYEIVFSRTKDVLLPARWLAILHRENGAWSIESYQITVNIFDNPLIARNQKVYGLAIIVAFIIGATMCMAWVRLRRKSM